MSYLSSQRATSLLGTQKPQGLNPEESFIVGVSFTFDGKTGYYLPIKHIEGVSLGQPALEWFYSKIPRSQEFYSV